MKLIFEYDGKQYGFKGPDATGFCSIVDSDGVFNKQLWEKFCDFEANEEKKHEFGYWWESQVSLARRAMEKEGAKILEFEDEEVDMEDKKGKPVISSVGGKMKRSAICLLAFAVAVAAKADYWMTFGRTPGGQQYSQVGYVKPDADGFVIIKAGAVTVAVHKTQVWYLKMPGEVPRMPNH